MSCVSRDFDEIISVAVVVEANADSAFLVPVRQFSCDTSKLAIFITAEVGVDRSLDFLSFKPLLMPLGRPLVARQVALQNEEATFASRVAVRVFLDVLGLVGNRHLSDTFVLRSIFEVGLPKYNFGKKIHNFFLNNFIFLVGHLIN